MVEKKAKTPAASNNPKNKQDKADPEDKSAERSSVPADTDRPGFDLGGASDKTRAGTGLGLGEDAAEDRGDRRLPGRKAKPT